MSDPNSDGVCGRRTVLRTGGLLIALLAGCTGGGDGSDSPPAEPTASPTPDPTETPTPEPTDTLPSIEAFEYPEGATADGVSASVASVHEATITDSGSVTITKEGQTNSSEGFSDSIGITTRISSAGVRRDTEGEHVTERLWAPASEPKSYVQMDSGFEQRYRIQNGGPSPDEALGIERLRSLLEAGDWSGVTGITEVGGVPSARYETTAVADQQAALQFLFGDSVAEFEAAVYVTQEGYVSRYEYGISVRRGDRTREETATVDVTGLGTTDASEPDWFDTAVEEGHAFDPAIVRDDQVVRLDVTNGPAVDGMAAQLSTARGFNRRRIPRTVGEGDTLNLALTEDGELVFGVNEVPERTTTFERGAFVRLTDGDFTLFERHLQV